MNEIIIVDDNQTTGVFLKQALERKAYQTELVPYEEEAILRFKPDKTKLVMINQACRKHSGWQIFNQVKLFYPDMPLMLYFLDNFRLSDAHGVVQAVTHTFERDANCWRQRFME